MKTAINTQKLQVLYSLYAFLMQFMSFIIVHINDRLLYR